VRKQHQAESLSTMPMLETEVKASIMSIFKNCES
jgi:hypothetical protein